MYSPDPRGRKPKDPVSMLRSLIYMVASKETSIDRWVKKLRHDEIYSIMSGWEYGDSPGVGTFYDFLDRLQDGPYQKKCSHIEKPSKMDKGWHIKYFGKEEKEKKKGEYAGRYDSVTQKLVDELLSSSENPRPNNLLKRLQDILMELAIKPSISRGLIDPMNLIISGDGSPIRSGANSRGKTACSCYKNNPFVKCNCGRLYKDPDSKWGYDSFREVFYYGDTIYQLNCYSNRHDFTLNIILGPASETDYTLCPKGFDSFIKMFKEHNIPFSIKYAILDKGQDAMGIYSYFQEKDIIPIIPLNSRGAKDAYRDNVKLSSKGIPLCPGGLEMRHISYDAKKMKHIFGCSVKRGTHRNGTYIYIPHVDECPLGTLCSPNTKHGPVISISSNDNPRLFPPIPRNSQKFKDLYRQRSGVERANSAKKVAYPIENAKLKTRARRLIFLYLAAIVEHRKIMFREKIKGLNGEQILEVMLANK